VPEEAAVSPIEFNESQARAVDGLLGQLVISAGAGSGKTRVLAGRFVRAVDPRRPIAAWEPSATDRILTITFTEKAAAELSERVRRFLAADDLQEQVRSLDGAWISTIHGFCSRILRRHAFEAGIDPQFSVASAVQAGLIADEAFDVAAREALGSDPAAVGLAGLYGIVAVAGTVRELHEELRARGASVDDIVLEPARPVREILAEAISVFTKASDDVAALVDLSKTTHQRNADACEEALGALLDVERSGLKEEIAIAQDIRRALGGCKFHRGCGGELKAVVSAASDRRDMLARQAVAVVTRSPGGALLRLVDAFGGEYARLKRERGLLDFEDLQSEALRVLESHEAIAQRYRRHFRLVMIDEFQDTNEVQSRLVRAVTDGDLCTVGDVNQAIYGFRHADVRVFERNTERMLADGAASVSLLENYRSHPDVLHFVNEAFRSEALLGPGFAGLIPKRKEADYPWTAGPRVRAIFAQGGRSGDAPRCAEAEALADEIADVVRHGVGLGDIAVLVRAYKHAEVYAAALRRRGFAVLVAGGDFLQTPEVVSVRSLLRLAVNSQDREAAGLLLTGPLVGVSDDGLRRIRLVAEGGTFTDALARWPEADLDEADRARVARALEAADKVASLVGTVPVADLILAALEAVDLDLAALSGDPDGARCLGNVLKLARLAREYDHTETGGLPGFLHHLTLQERFGERSNPAAVVDEETQAIRIMSVHSAKGLEFPVVALPGLGNRSGSGAADRYRLGAGDAPFGLALGLPGGGEGETSTPLFESLDEEAKAEDEREARRLFYVGCTRAENILVLSGLTTYAKPKAGEATSLPIKWVRSALGMDAEALSPGESTVRCGTDVKVRVLADVASQPTGEIEPHATPGPGGEPAGEDLGAAGLESAQRTDGGFTLPAELSYTDIATFEACPLKFRAERTLGLPGWPSESSLDPLSFGDAVHAVLSLGESVTGTGLEERLDTIAKSHGLDADAAERLRVVAEAFHRSDAASALRAAPKVSREAPFAIDLGTTRLSGYLDAIAWTAAHCLIVDYKSGVGGKADLEALRDRYRRQAECYALAAFAAGAAATDVVFVRLEDLAEGAVPREIRFAWEADDAGDVRASVQRVVEEIAEGVFGPLPAYRPIACDGCAVAGGLCPVHVPTVPGCRR